MKAVKILLAEDEDDIADILRAYLEKEAFEVLRAKNGREAMTIFRENQPDFVILDIKMPVLDGWEVLYEIRQMSEVPTMMLTALDADIDKIHALRSGADDYIVKPFNPAEVVARVHVILRRMPFYKKTDSAGLYNTKNIAIDQRNHSVKIKSGNVDIGSRLTSTEFKILLHLIRYPKRVFTRRELMENCLPEGDTNERTVDSHISKLRKKIEQAGLPAVPESIRGFGYRLGD